MTVAFPGESAEYRAARNRLLDQEIELRRAMEAVADARRLLPPGGVVPEDYVFQAQGPDGAQARVRLSELFAPGKNSLVIYSMMFPRAADDNSPGPPGGQTSLLPLAEGPCPSCTALLDQLDGAAGHVSQHVTQCDQPRPSRTRASPPICAAIWTHGCARREAAIRQLEFDARAHDDGALAGKPEVFGGVSGDS